MTTPNKPNGLILAGGFSKRMGQDKALLTYNGKLQLERAYELLVPACNEVYISVRPDQAQRAPYNRFAQIADDPTYAGIGPLGGILSALAAHPQAAWLVLACDLPFVTAETIQHLIAGRQPAHTATAFISTHDQLPEPVCAIWEPQSREAILPLLASGIQCPRKVLIKSQTHLIQQADPHWLDNVNTPAEYEAASRSRLA